MFVLRIRFKTISSSQANYCRRTHVRMHASKQAITHLYGTYSYIEHIVSYKRRDTITVSSGMEKMKTKDSTFAVLLLYWGTTNGQIVNEWETWLSNIAFITIGIPTIRSWNELEFAISTLTGLFCLNPWYTGKGSINITPNWKSCVHFSVQLNVSKQRPKFHSAVCKRSSCQRRNAIDVWYKLDSPAVQTFVHIIAFATYIHIEMAFSSHTTLYTVRTSVTMYNVYARIGCYVSLFRYEHVWVCLSVCLFVCVREKT